MTPLIDSIIQPRKYELIRDMIGSIIAVELANQSKLTRNENINASVYVERFVSYDIAEGNVVVVSLEKGEFDNQTVLHQRSNLVFNIDVYCSSTQDYINNGDNKVGVLVHKLTGIIQAIIQDARYIKLNFNDGIIENRTVGKVEFYLPDDDSKGFQRIGRIKLYVMSNETFEVNQGTLLRYLDTIVKLQETEQGYKFNIQ